MVCSRDLHVQTKFRHVRLNGYGVITIFIYNMAAVRNLEIFEFLKYAHFNFLLY